MHCALNDHVPQALRAVGKTVELRPLPASMTMYLDLPSQGLTAVAAQVDLTRGFLVEFDIDARAVDELPAILTGRQWGTALQGFVLFEYPGQTAESVPVAIRLADAGGTLFDIETLPGAGSDGLELRLRNATASPLRLDGLVAWLKRAGRHGLQSLTPATVALRTSLPARTLAPGESVELSLRTERTLDGDGPLCAEFDFDAVRAVPDAVAPLLREA